MAESTRVADGNRDLTPARDAVLASVRVSAYPHLFAPLQIGNVTIRNRLMQTAHAKMYTANCVDSRRDHDYHVERAKGGIGLIVSGNRLVHPSAASGLPRISAWSYRREAIATDRLTTVAVHRDGAAIFVQLNHFGSTYASSEAADDPRVLWGPKGRIETPTPTPIRMRVVRSAIAAAMIAGRGIVPNSERWCSASQTESKPSSSA